MTRTSVANLFISLALVTSVGLGCMGFRKPWRDYSEKPFTSREWLDGDRIERGRMTLDIFKKRIPNGKSRELVREIFGEPDKKRTIENKEVWFYKTDVGVPGALDNFPISFDEKGRGYVGYVHGSTISIGASDDDI